MTTEKRLEDYVDSLFADAPNTPKTAEMRGRMLDNMVHRYHELTEDGMDPEEAFGAACRCAEDAHDTIWDADAACGEHGFRETLHRRKTRSALLGTAICLYILSPAFVILFSMMKRTDIGVVALLVCAAAATGILVYARSMRTRPVISRAGTVFLSDEEMADFQMWRSHEASDKRRAHQWSGVFWLAVLACYLVLSFMTGAWYITWLTFIIGAAAEKLIQVIVH